MTAEQATHFLERELPSLRKKFCRDEIDYDALQVAMSTFVRKSDRITDDKAAFAYLWSIFCYNRQWLYRKYNNRLMFCGSVTEQSTAHFVHDYPYMYQHREADQHIKQQAVEYLAEIANPRHRRVCELHYIEGYSATEIGEQMGLSRQRIENILAQGVKRIQKALKARGEL